MAAELWGYEQAHTRSPPHTMGNPREMERPAPLEGNGSRAQAVREVRPTISSRKRSTSRTSSGSFPASEVTFHVPSARDRAHGLGRPGTSPPTGPKHTAPTPMVLLRVMGLRKVVPRCLFGLGRPGPGFVIRTTGSVQFTRSSRREYRNTVKEKSALTSWPSSQTKNDLRTKNHRTANAAHRVRTQLTEVRTQLTEVERSSQRYERSSQRYERNSQRYERSSQSTNAAHRVRTQLTEVRTQVTEYERSSQRYERNSQRVERTHKVRTQLTEVRTQLTEVRTQLTEVRTQLTEVRTSLTEVRTQLTEVRTQLTEDEPMDTDQSSSFVSSEIAKYQLLIETENQKLQRYKIENIRRKHNYLPFIMELLKTLAEYQQLMPLVERVQTEHTHNSLFRAVLGKYDNNRIRYFRDSRAYIVGTSIRLRKQELDHRKSELK
ncbi:hypothetical protein WMY93_025357 [Mugilogobius chulae]|uniref:UCH37-like C-terminal domain-containing protein n=1 Tax=Mugilogobius chulae TaxID=88201 RepID=A0AAW0NDA3_9GOBI